jgi:hypothetical protein
MHTPEERFMATGKNEIDNSQPSNRNLSIVYKNGAKCTEFAAGPRPDFLMQPNSESSPYTYSGYEPELVTASHDLYFQKPSWRTRDQRRHTRVSLATGKACIETDHSAPVIVDMVNISRGGLCFRSAAEFSVDTLVSVATHYIEGGLNIFQEGYIVRVQRRPSENEPGEYAIQFPPRAKDASAPPAADSQHSPARKSLA